MSCQPNQPCDTTCSSHDQHHGSNGVPDIEDYKSELASLKARTADLERQLSQAGISITPSHTNGTTSSTGTRKLRSANWFNDPTNPEMTALYTERHFNYGLTPEELNSGKPIIGIAQSGNDIAPCNRNHLELAKRVREGIRSAGGIAFEFPTHPIQESVRRPTATLDRNLLYLGLVEILYAYPLDGVVLLTGCDKVTPAMLMAAATVNIPALCLNVGPMLNGRLSGLPHDKIGSGTILWKARDMHAAGEIDDATLVEMIAAGTPSIGHCNTMGTASTMNALAEALGMALPGSAGIPAPYRERAQCAFRTGKQIVEMVHADRKPSDIMTREAFENVIVVNSAIGGSTNAPIHMNAVAKHIGVPLNLDDWDAIGFHIPLLLNVQPAGEMLCEEAFKAGGLPAVMGELLAAGKLHGSALTCNGNTVAQNVSGAKVFDAATILPYSSPLKKEAGFLHMTGNLFDSAIMKTSVISDDFRKEFLEDPHDPMAFECKAVVFDGREDFYARIEDPKLGVDKRTILVMRGAGPLGYP